MSDIHIKFPTKTARNLDLDAGKYVLSKELAGAVEVALTLSQPLLLTGKPGTGKTRLAWRIAHDLHQLDPSFRSEPHVFFTKTTSAAQDLFYDYDAFSHFHEANIRKAAGEASPKASQFIKLRALGKAIAHTNPKGSGGLVKGKPQSSVVLIDEIDKAPRDFPNDLLNEFSNYSFQIRENDNQTIDKSPDHRIVIVLTSNSEKNLPEAFLRRCVFYHIPFPDENHLLKIVRSHLGQNSKYTDLQLIRHFDQIRTVVRKKEPATAELLNWLHILEVRDFLENDLDFTKLTDRQKEILRYSYSVLAKTQDDLEILESRFLMDKH